MTTKETPQSPGSYADFVAANPDLDAAEASSLYYGSLDSYRGGLAEHYGISREELHSMDFRRIGSIPTQLSAESSELVESVGA